VAADGERNPHLSRIRSSANGCNDLVIVVVAVAVAVAVAIAIAVAVKRNLDPESNFFQRKLLVLVITSATVEHDFLRAVDSLRNQRAFDSKERKSFYRYWTNLDPKVVLNIRFM